MVSSNQYSKFPISPSDIGQSYVRLFLVLLLFFWSYFNEGKPSLDRFPSNPVLAIGTGYIIYSCLFLLLSYRLQRSTSIAEHWFHIKRVIGLVGDLVTVALLIFLAGEYGLAVYPVYITIIVGHGKCRKPIAHRQE